MNRFPRLLAIAALCAAAGAAHAQTVIGGGKGGVSFPIVISQPGSYKLAGNLTVPAGVNAIEVIASNVTLDLNGYTITGAVVCTGGYWTMSCTAGGDGIVQKEASAQFTTVRNGSLRGFATAIHLGSSALVEEVALTANGKYGLVAQDGSVVRNVRASYNRDAGLLVNHGVVSHSTSTLSPIGFLMTGGLLIASATDMASQAVVGSYGGPSASTGVRESVLRSNGASMTGAFVSLGNNLCNGMPC